VAAPPADWRGGLGQRQLGCVAPEADVGYCRANLTGHLGAAVADDFLSRWQALTGRDSYHPYWDIAVEVGPADFYGDDPDPELDAWIARAVAELG
jgi:hypothetical protein